MDRNEKRIDDWLLATGTTESRLGLLACANPRAVDRIRNGSATVATLNSVLAYIAKNPAKKTATQPNISKKEQR